MQKLIVPVLLALVSAACGGTAKLTESQEYFVGRGVAANALFDSKGEFAGFHKDERLEEYVSLVGLTVAMESDRPETFKGYLFGIVASDDINAFAAPGGFIFVTTGALRNMESEDELAGVLAHEIAHVNLRHPEDHANRAANKAGVMETASVLGSAAAFIGRAAGHGRTVEQAQTMVKGLGTVIDDLVKEIMVNGYGRDSELAADALGVRVLCRPGVKYDPGALKAFIARLPKKERGAWATHPELEGRLQNIDEAIQKQGAAPAPADPVRTTRFRAAMAGLKGQ